MFGSVCPSVRLFYTISMARSGQYMGSACRVLRKITMTHGIQSKISVCLSVIKERSRSRAVCSGRGLLIMHEFRVGRWPIYTDHFLWSNL